jgi:PhnB protein
MARLFNPGDVQMASVGTYLNFDGNAEDVMNFYADVFDTQVMSIMRYGDFHMEGADAEGAPEMSETAKNAVMNMQMLIFGDYLLQASDHLAEFGGPLVQGNNTAIVLMTDSRAETDRLFALLADGGNVRFAPADAGFGYFADLSDKFGTNWMFYNTAE